MRKNYFLTENCLKVRQILEEKKARECENTKQIIKDSKIQFFVSIKVKFPEEKQRKQPVK